VVIAEMERVCGLVTVPNKPTDNAAYDAPGLSDNERALRMLRLWGNVGAHPSQCIFICQLFDYLVGL
jgi:hypothetical protein